MKCVPVLINGKWTLNLPEHRARQWSHPWEVERLNSMSRNIKPNQIVVDIGAENGDMTALFADWVGKFGGVIAVEAVANYWPWIKQTFEANGLKPPLESFVGFASDKNSIGDPLDVGNYGPTTYYPWPPAVSNQFIEEPGFQSVVENKALPHLTIDEIVGEHRIHILTFDTEGSELEVLRGAEKVLKRDKPLVYASIHPEFIKRDYGHEPQEVYDFLYSLGYNHTLLAQGHEDHVVFYDPNVRVPE